MACLGVGTAGRSAAAAVLVGILHVGSTGLHINQLLARDYAEEPAVLVAAAHLLENTKLLVSFNGRAFDIPFLQDRMRYHRLACTIQPAEHLDVLLVARRQRDLNVPDHRLVTLETHLCRRRRGGDIPSDQVPQAYHDFVATGETDRLALILQHNQIDLLTTAELASRWAADWAPNA